MIDINRKKKLRYLFLQRLYELTDGSENKRVAISEIASALEASPQEISDVCQYLKGEYLAERVNLSISITHAGVVQIEKALSEPDKPTQYFPPVNIINVNQMHGSVIQQGTVQSAQSVQLAESAKHEISEFLAELTRALSGLDLPKETESEVSADITTIEVQFNSGRPKPRIIKESLLSIQRILEGAGGAILAQQLLSYLPALLSRLTS